MLPEDEPGDLVFGMGTSPMAESDWPPLTLAEVDGAVEIEWRSPRPLSSTARLRLADGRRVVVKRMALALRDAAALAEEHAFADHLRSRGVPIPAVRSWTRAEFAYEMHDLGVGADRYRGVFSWTPYLSLAHAASAGRMLARLHRAAEGFDAPARPPRPLTAALCTDPIATVATYAAARPAVADFLAERSWRDELAWPPIDLGDLAPLWTHNDWHGTNLLWSGDEITAVFDFGLANRTTAVFDLAVAIERFAVDWLALRDGGPARVHAEQLAAFLRAYLETRPLTPAECRALPRLFPLAHIAYELSEIDYFLAVPPRPNRDNAELAYREYLVGHLHWVRTAAGRDFLQLLGQLTR
ncbi:phosphotransferase [Nocardia sp. CDC159]|uniref:Phosphotransferase n=1 Tax=Nocardia pulmonis TaxID=2951408 RepID=A0A9X2ECZ4_9NOCA|nr:MULTISPECIES: phosphotransferase [Nocardia]MCM6777105.1 phosphotransferase [Nocardia pulmonis]MCM6789990.1 phosphotransferase [Nocardia sp. CDC159]